MDLRPYQKECLESIIEHQAQGITCQGVSKPCGSGKAVDAAMLPTYACNLPGESLFFIAHRHELISQAANKFRLYNPQLTVGIERAEERSCPDADVVVGSVQSLTTKRLKKFDPERFRIIAIDECHHMFDSKHYQTILEYFGVHRSRNSLSRSKLLVGFSATWRRGDSKGAEHLFDKIVFHRSIRDIMQSGIYVGNEWCPYLAPIRGDRQLSELHLDKVHVSKGRLVDSELSEAVNTPERNEAVVDTYLEKGEDLPALAFTVDIQHSKDLAQAFCKRGIQFVHLSGDTPKDERAQAFRDFESGSLRGLISCGVLSEGTDLPRAVVGLMCKPTLSTVVYTQAFGRITRPYPAPEERLAALEAGRSIPWVKPYGIWIDFTDSSTKHNLVQAPTLFGLRPDFAFKGKDVEETIKAIEEAKAKNPSLDLNRVRSLEDLTRSSVSFAALDVPLESVEIRKWSVYPWVSESENTWALSIRGTNSVLRVRREHEKEFSVWSFYSGSGSRRKTESTLRIAIKEAERLLDKKEKKLLQRDAPWRRDPPTHPQCTALFCKDAALRKQFRNADAFYSYAHGEHAKGNVEFSKGSIADQLNIYLIANRFGGHSKQGWASKAIAGIKARMKG